MHGNIQGRPKGNGKPDTFLLIRGSRNTELSQGNKLHVQMERFNCYIYTCNSFILVFSLSPHPSKVFPELNREWLQGSSINYCLCQGRWPLDVCAEKQNGEGWKVFQNFLGSPLSTLWEGITKSTLAWLKRQKQNKFSKHHWRTVMEPFNQVISGLRFILKADQIQSAS